MAAAIESAAACLVTRRLRLLLPASPTHAARPRAQCELPGGPERLLVRRSVGQEPGVKYHRTNAPPEVSLPVPSAVRSRRWAVEECLELAEGDCGLDECEVRSWQGWHRHVTLGLLALAVVAAIRSRLPAQRRAKKGAAGWCV